MTNVTVSDLVSDAQARRESYDQLAETAQELLAAVTTVLSKPDDLLVPGWRIKRIPVSDFGLEIALCESTEDHLPFTVREDEARNVLVMVRRGLLHVTYDDALGGFTIGPDNFALLPGGIRRTSFAAQHPTTLFAVFICGKATDSEQLSTAYRRLLDR